VQTPAIKETPRSVAYDIHDPTARRRLLTALESEGLSAVSVELEPLASGVRQLPAGLVGLVHDLAPWTDAAPVRLRDLRHRARELPILIYAPVRPGVAQLLIDVARIHLLSAQLVLDGPEEVGRLKRSIRYLLAAQPRRTVMRRLALGTGGLPAEAEAFCELVLSALEKGDGGVVTVKEVARRLGTDRRTLERHLRAARLPSPGELLDWMLLLYSCFASRDHEERLPSVARSLDLDPRRLRRIRLRLEVLGTHPLERTVAFEDVVNGFLLRCRELRYGAGRRRRIAARSGKPVRGRRWVVVTPGV
jgi:DNA-binding transcriptional ArsR family regulator